MQQMTLCVALKTQVHTWNSACRQACMADLLIEIKRSSDMQDSYRVHQAIECRTICSKAYDALNISSHFRFEPEILSTNSTFHSNPS